MYLFELASRHMTWLAERQAITAANIANSETSGYRARDLGAFSTYLEDPSAQLATTSPLHIGTSTSEAGNVALTFGKSWGSSHSGNNVSLEQELMTASSSSRMMNVDSSLTRIFQRMLLSSVKA